MSDCQRGFGTIAIGKETACRSAPPPNRPLRRPLPAAAGLTARLAESDIVMGLQRELWYPMLEAARDRGELRTDRDFDDIIRWITFLEFSLITSGEVFGFAAEGDCRDALTAYLVPALRP